MKTLVVALLALLVCSSLMAQTTPQHKSKRGTATTAWDSLVVGQQTAFVEGWVTNDEAAGGNIIIYNVTQMDADEADGAVRVYPGESHNEIRFMGKKLYYVAVSGTVAFRMNFQAMFRIP